MKLSIGSEDVSLKITTLQEDINRVARDSIVEDLKSNKKISEVLNSWVNTIAGFIEGFTSYYGKPVVLYKYQVDFVNDNSSFKLVNKSRQVGFSFVISALALAKAHLLDNYQAIFISINREEASNKISYARALYESLPDVIKKKKVVDNKYSLVFESKTGTTRLISLAQRSPRGPGNNVDVFLDEFAHFYWSDEIYVAALPIITRGGTLVTLSTPFGNRGKFYDIYNNRDAYPEFKVYTVPWWECPDFCLNTEAAIKNAGKMETRDRILKYANDKLKQIYKSMSEEDFKQEYECIFVDESTTYLPLSLIQSCLFSYEEDDWLREVEVDIEDRNRYVIEQKYPSIKFKAYSTLDDFLFAYKKGEIDGNLIAGFDVGRAIDSSILVILEEIKVNNTILRIVRCVEEFKNVMFKEQENILSRLLSKNIISTLVIDKTGIGYNLVENLEQKYPNCIEGVIFTASIKSHLARKVKICLEQQVLALPDNIDLVRQIHSIKRIITDANWEKYKPNENSHHGDKFWALALAVYGSSPLDMNETIEVNSVIGVGGKMITPVASVIRNDNNYGFLSDVPVVGFDIVKSGNIPTDLDIIPSFKGRNRYDY